MNIHECGGRLTPWSSWIVLIRLEVAKNNRTRINRYYEQWQNYMKAIFFKGFIDQKAHIFPLQITSHVGESSQSPKRLRNQSLNFRPLHLGWDVIGGRTGFARNRRQAILDGSPYVASIASFASCSSWAFLAICCRPDTRVIESNSVFWTLKTENNSCLIASLKYTCRCI